jgi:hypothetical protein
LAGSRLRRLWVAAGHTDSELVEPPRSELLAALAAHDRYVFESMRPDDWWAHFFQGWQGRAW